MYSITEYQYQQLRNRYPSDEVIRDEISRQSIKVEAQPQADNSAINAIPCSAFQAGVHKQCPVRIDKRCYADKPCMVLRQ